VLGISIAGAIVSGLVGLAFWKYRIYKEAIQYGKTFPLAQRVCKNLKLDISDFRTDRGLEFIHMIQILEEQLAVSNLNITKFTRKELDYLSDCLSAAITIHCNLTKSWLPYKFVLDSVQLRNNTSILIETTIHLVKTKEGLKDYELLQNSGLSVELNNMNNI